MKFVGKGFLVNDKSHFISVFLNIYISGKDILDSRGRDDNTAWRCWLKADRQIIARGGRGGKPAVSGGWFSGWFSGSKGGDGEGGEPGPHGGRGGEGGKGQG